MNMKRCTICDQPKLLTSFHKSKVSSDGRLSQCTECQRLQARRIQQQRKQDVINALGGCCSRCGYAKCLGSLTFHHPNDDKEANVSALARVSFEAILTEAKKCIVLCANCHGEEHFTPQGPPLGRRWKTTGCGTVPGYKQCGPPPCDACVAAYKNSLRTARWREKKLTSSTS